MKRRFFLALCIATGIVIGGFVAITREHECRAPWQPLLLDDRALDSITEGLPVGWSAGAPGVRVGTFSIDGGASIHLLGIGTWLELPELQTHEGAHICVSAKALADSSSATKLRTRWIWTTKDGASVTHLSPWRTVRRWEGQSDREPWSHIGATSVAPAGAIAVRVRFEPASDDRIYLDTITTRTSHVGSALPVVAASTDSPLTIRPWPAGSNAAVSFSYDFESAMGGLVHSRSVDDPNAALDPLVRAARMRDGLWKSLELYAPYGYAATYYVNGYNFLNGNAAQRRFMNDPTFTWATKENGWQSDIWSTQPWFSRDPYAADGTAPDWYFADLLIPLLNGGHSIQSHTFSHFYGGYASTAEWGADLQSWNTLAAEHDIPAATSLAFPWSSSAGMSYANWELLEAAGITSLTRTAWNPRLPQYHIVDATEARCIPLPGHERIMVCPDYYLTVARTPDALLLLSDIRTRDGMIDFWAHTEEVTTPEQIAAWKSVVDACAQANDVWVAPLASIAARQQQINALQQIRWHDIRGTHIRLTNPLPVAISEIALRLEAGWVFASNGNTESVIDLAPRQTIVLDIRPVD
ncbi:MAG: hypothetical protein RLY87_2321 [Chloroflexota bacterium]|jgi:hypothetical protein